MTSGDGFAAGCVAELFASSGTWINVEPGFFFADGGHVSLGDGSGLGRDARVYGADIGRDVMMAPEVVILCRNHRHDDPNVPIRSQGTAPWRSP